METRTYPEGREPWRERRAGLSWDQIAEAIEEKVWIGTDESGPTYQYVETNGAADAIWELLKPYSSFED